MAKFGENIQEFSSTLTLNRVPVTNVGDRWLIMNDKNTVDVKQGSTTVQTWLLMDGRSHSFTSSIVHFGGMLYSVMDHKVLIRWSIDDSSLRNPEKVEFQEAVFDILSVPEAEPLVIFKSGQLAVIDTKDFPNTKPISMKIRNQLDWADAAKTETGVRVFYKTHSETAKHITLYYFTIDNDKQRSSANCSYNIRPEKVTFKCCALNHSERSFLSLWSDGSIRYFDDEKEDQLLFSIGDIDKDTTIVDMTCLDSRHIAIVKGKVFSQECSLEIWDFKKHLLKGRHTFKTHHHLQNLHISVSDNYILIHFHSRILAIPFTLDTSFLASLNTNKAEVYKEHAWDDGIDLIEVSVETEKMEGRLLDDILNNSPEDAVEKLLNRDLSDFRFLPEYELVKLLKLVVNCKKNKKSEECTKEKLNTLLYVVLWIYILMELLVSFLKESEVVPKDAKTPSDFHIINWMYAVLSSKTESLIIKDHRTKMIFIDLKKIVCKKLKEYEELESVRSYFSLILKDKSTLPEEYSEEKYSVDTLNLTFPTVEKRCKQLQGADYVGLPSPSVFVDSLLIRLGISVSSKTFVLWRDKVDDCMQLPVIAVKVGDHEIWPVLSFSQLSLLVCCLPLVDGNQLKDRDNLLQVPAISVGFSVLLGILNFLSLKYSEERPSQLKDLDSFLTLSMPFGSPSVTDLSIEPFINNVQPYKFTKRQSALKPVNYKGKQQIHIRISEFVRCIQIDQNKSLCHYEVFGQIFVQANLEDLQNDVTLCVSTSDKSCPLDSIVLHPCVHMHGATATHSVSSLLRRLRFSPPLHEFVLLQYHSPDIKEPPIKGVFKMLGENPVELLIQLKLSENVKNYFEFCDVILVFFNRGPVKSSEMNFSYGVAKLSDDKHSLKWSIGSKFPKELEVALTAKLEFQEKPVLANSDPFCVDKNCYVQINFKQENSTLSGCNIDPKSVVVSQGGKTKVTTEKSVQSTEYRLWNNYGDLPFPVNIEDKFEKLFA